MSGAQQIGLAVELTADQAIELGLLMPDEIPHEGGHIQWSRSPDDFLDAFGFNGRVGLVLGLATARRRDPAFLCFMNSLLGAGVAR